MRPDYSISIIIVTYNNADDIIACIKSVPWRDQKIQILLIDNHSKDRTLKNIQKFLKIHPDCPVTLFLQHTNLGYAQAVNIGLRNSRYEWTLILGPDTELLPESLERLIHAIEKNPKIGMIAPQLLDHSGKVHYSCRKFPIYRDVILELSGLPRLLPNRFKPVWKMLDFDYQKAMEVDQPEASCLLVRKKAIRSVGYMDPRFPLFFNDVDWCRRFYKNGWKIRFEPSIKVLHKKGTSVNQFPMKKIFKSHQGFYRYFMKYATTSKERLQINLMGGLLLLTTIPRVALEFIQTQVEQFNVQGSGLMSPNRHNTND